jgi:hypothetical protein
MRMKPVEFIRCFRVVVATNVLVSGPITEKVWVARGVEVFEVIPASAPCCSGGKERDAIP